MRLCNCYFEELNRLEDGNASVVCFGVSKHMEVLNKKLGSSKWMERILYFVDNDDSLINTTIEIEGRLFKVLSPNTLLDESKFAILITSVKYEALVSILEQLVKMNLPDTVKCYSVYMMEHFAEKQYDNSVLERYPMSSTKKIDKKIFSIV